MQQSKHTTLNIPPELRQKARAKAISEGSNLSAVVVAFLEAWLADEIEVPTPQPKEKKGGKHKIK